MKKLVCAVFAATMTAGSAQAMVIEFAYSNTFNTRVENVTSTAPALANSYREPDAEKGLYNGSSSILITGQYDLSDVVDTGSGQYVTAQINSLSFDSLAIIFTNFDSTTGIGLARLSLTNTGVLAFSYDLPRIGTTRVYEMTSITSQLSARDSAGLAFDLGRNSEFGTDKSQLVNLYGRNDVEYNSIPVSDSSVYFNRYGALVANSFTTSNKRPVLEGGLFTLAAVAEPAGVPEPAGWAMMMIGFGAIGEALRRRRSFGPHPFRPSRQRTIVGFV